MHITLYVIYEMFRKATEQEIAWSNHIIGDPILGITSQTIEQYTKFFETKISSYNQSTVVKGWDETSLDKNLDKKNS